MMQKTGEMNQLVSQIEEWIAGHEAELVDFVTDLMRIESVTYNESEAVKYLAKKMEEYRFDEVRIDDAGSCIGRVGSGAKVIVADAHIDTVEPGTKEQWGFDPLDPQVVDGVIRGRGIIDDKGCLSAMVFAARAIKELGLDDEVTLWVSGSISEEDVEGSCVRAMMEQFDDIKPDMILVGEPSGNRIIRGHKGRALLKLTVKGKAAHASAAHRGENALIKALPLIDAIDKMNDFTVDEFLGKGSIEVTKVICDTPSLNTIPGAVTIIADRRISCGESEEELIGELEAAASCCGATISIDTEEVTSYTGKTITQRDYFPSWVIEPSHPVITSAVSAFKALYCQEPEIGKWDFCTNATYLCGITGIPSVGFGPGDETLCHGPEESLEISELCKAVGMYALTALQFSRS